MSSLHSLRTIRCTGVLVVALALAWSLPALADKKPTRLTLPELMARAKSNPLSRAARQATLAAKARVAEARGARLGSISVTSFLAPSPNIECRDEAGATVKRPSNWRECDSTNNKDVSIGISGIFTGVRATWTLPVFTFGKLGAIGDAAKRAATATRAKEGSVAGKVAVEVARVYYGLKLARELRWMLEDGRDEINKAMKKLDKHLAAGTGDVTVQDKLRLDTLVAEVGVRLVDAKASEANALAAIRVIAKDKAIDIDEEALEPTKFTLLAKSAAYLAKARSHHPQLDAARAGLQAVKALERYERRKWFPDLALVAGVSFSVAPDVPNAPSAFANDPYNTLGASLGLVLRWKIEPLMTRARVNHAQANTRRAAALLDGAVLAADLSVSRAHNTAKQARQKLALAKRGEKSAKGWVASVVQADAIGVISAKDMADAYVAYFTAKARVLQSLYEWNLAVIKLRRVSGEFAAAHKRRKD